MNAKQEKLALISCFCHNLTNFVCVFWHFDVCVCAQFTIRVLSAPKNSNLESLSGCMDSGAVVLNLWFEVKAKSHSLRRWLQGPEFGSIG